MVSRSVAILKQPVPCDVLNLLQWEWSVYHLEDGNFEDILMEYPCWHTQVSTLFYCLHQIFKVFSSPLAGINFLANMSILCSFKGGILQNMFLTELMFKYPKETHCR